MVDTGRSLDAACGTLGFHCLRQSHLGSNIHDCTVSATCYPDDAIFLTFTAVEVCILQFWPTSQCRKAAKNVLPNGIMVLTSRLPSESIE